DAIRLGRVCPTGGASMFWQTGLAESNGNDVFRTALDPFAGQSLRQSPAAILAASADGYFQNLSGADRGNRDRIFSDAIPAPAAQEEQPDETPLPAIDAILADGSLFHGEGR